MKLLIAALCVSVSFVIVAAEDVCSTGEYCAAGTSCVNFPPPQQPGCCNSTASLACGTNNCCDANNDGFCFDPNTCINSYKGMAIPAETGCTFNSTTYATCGSVCCYQGSAAGSSYNGQLDQVGLSKILQVYCN